MPIAEVAEALFATVDANAIIQCGTAIQAISGLYGDLSSSLDTAVQTLFSAQTAWSGPAAGNAQGGMASLSSESANLQSALSTIGQTLVEYGTAMQPFQKKIYPTPVPGSRDPEAAADLALVGVASTLASAQIATAVVKLLPIAHPKGGKQPSTHLPVIPASTTSHPASGATLAGYHGPVPSLLAPGSSPAIGSIGSSPLGLDPLLSNGVLGVGSLVPGEGGAVPEDVVPGEAAAGERMPLMPMAGAHENEFERDRSGASDDDAEFLTETPLVAGAVIGA